MRGRLPGVGFQGYPGDRISRKGVAYAQGG